MATPKRPTMSVHAVAPGRDPKTVVFTISGRIDPEDVSPLCEYVCARLESGNEEHVVCDLGDALAPDAVALDALARLQLATRRRGCNVELRNASPELLGLLDLVGLSDVMPVADG